MFKASLALAAAFFLVFVSLQVDARGRKVKDPCARIVTTPLVIKAASVDSSRRIKLITQSGTYEGAEVYTEWVEIKDASGAVTKLGGGLLTVSMNDIFIEGLSAGATYEIRSGSNRSCVPASLPVRVTMPQDIPEVLAPVIEYAKISLMGAFGFSNTYIEIKTHDDTAIADFKAYMNAALISTAGGFPIAGQIRYWTEQSGIYNTQNGSRIFMLVPYELLGSGGGEVTVEVTDVFGNKSQLTQYMSF